MAEELNKIEKDDAVLEKSEVKKAFDELKADVWQEFEGKAYEKLQEQYGPKFEKIKKEVKGEIDSYVKKFGLGQLQEEALNEEEENNKGHGKDNFKEFVVGCTKGMFTGVGDHGGYFVTERQLPNFFGYIENNSFVRGRSTNIVADSSMPEQVIQIPKMKQADDGSLLTASFYPVGEGRAFTNTDAKLELTKLEPKKHGCSVDVPNETIRNVPAAETFLNQVLKRAAVAYENRQFIRGTGGAFPVGILESETKHLEPRDAAGDIKYTDVVNMLEHCMLGEKNSYIWLATQKAFGKIFPMVDGTSTYRAFQDGKLEGIPLIWTDSCSTLGDQGDLILVNFNYYLTLMGQDFTLDQSKEHKFNRDMTVVRAKYTLDADLWLEKPILKTDETVVSPVVVLSDAV